jgi:low affinity Fe/Cu permease
MKQVEKIWSEMASKKAELSKEKVQLAAIDDLKKVIAQGVKIENSVNRDIKALQKKYDDYIRSVFAFEDNTLGPIRDIVADLEPKMEEAARQAKKLGVVPISIEEIDLAQRLLKRLNNVWGEASEVWRSAKQF